MASQDEIEERQDKVAFLLTKGATGKDIATQLGVSRETVERDIAVLREKSQDWFNKRAKEGFVFKYKIIMDQLESIQRDLQIIKQTLDEEALALKKEGKAESSAHLDRRLKVIRSIEENIVLQGQFDAEIPTLQSLKRAIAETGKSEPTSR